jgi:hypothetical protein
MMNLDEALERYDPAATALGRRVVEELTSLVPGAQPIVFVASYAVTVSFSFTDRWKDGFCFVAFYRNHANLSFHHGAELPDPAGILNGEGKQIRHIRIDAPGILDRPEVRALVLCAAERVPSP